MTHLIYTLYLIFVLELLLMAFENAVLYTVFLFHHVVVIAALFATTFLLTTVEGFVDPSLKHLLSVPNKLLCFTKLADTLIAELFKVGVLRLV